jgi:hypothetical protein
VQFRSYGRAVIERLATGAAWTVNRGLPGVTALLAAAYVLLGAFLLLVIAVGEGNRPPSEQAWGAGLLIISGLLIAWGFRLAPRRRRRGVALVVAGVTPLSLVFGATVIVPLASVVAVLAAAIRRRAATA